MNNIDFSSLAEYQPYHATLADLYRRSCQLLAVSNAYLQAIELTNNRCERAFLKKQRLDIQRQLS